jgi:hypothetical protein
MRDALRAHAKMLRRQFKHWHAFATADIVFLSPAKSGRTWLRAMLSHVYHLSYGTPVDQLVSRDRFHRLEPRIPRFFVSHATSGPFSLRRRLTPRGLRRKTVVCLVRDPRDTVVSFFHQRGHRKKQASGSAESRTDATLTDDYIKVALAPVVAKVSRLEALAAAHQDGHLFRYEDLHADPAAELGRLLCILGHHDVPQSHIEAAVAFAAFDQLQQREAAGFFRSDNLRPTDAAEPNSFKVRRGKVGGYRDELTAEQIATMDRVIDATLPPGLGYRTDEPAPRHIVTRPPTASEAGERPAGSTTRVPGVAVDRRWFAVAAMVAGLLGTTASAVAGEAMVVDVEALPEAGGTWQFVVTVRHADQGWDHYADKWQVLAPDGTELGERVLLHPHVDEQPFTRSLGGVAVPNDLAAVEIRAHDTVDSWGPRR